jgi:hypothetical protein
MDNLQVFHVFAPLSVYTTPVANVQYAKHDAIGVKQNAVIADPEPQRVLALKFFDLIAKSRRIFCICFELSCNLQALDVTNVFQVFFSVLGQVNDHHRR